MSVLSRLFGGAKTRPEHASPSNGFRPGTGSLADAVASEARVFAIGAELLDAADRHRSGLLSTAFWRDKLMDWSMKDPAFKVQLFRFVDTFPALRTPEDVHDHLVDYLSQPGVNLPPGMATAMKAGGVAKGLFTTQVTSQIEAMATNFIAGTDAASALPKLEKLWKRGIAFSVDLLGEACVSDAEADVYRDKYLDLVTNLPERVASWSPTDRLERDHLGPVPRTNVSIKVSALCAQLDPIAPEKAIADVMPRLEPILRGAGERGVFVNFDMEDFSTKDLTIELFFRCCERFEFDAGLAMQAYLRSGDADAHHVAERARSLGRPITVRLVKGAYWDYEVIHAELEGWPCPVWTEKRDTDACFERMSRIFLDATPRSTGQGGVKLALGSHNARSIGAALAMLDERDLPREAIELQMLHGMAPELKGAAADLGLRIREYVPVGEMIPGMAYLVRRLLENTSNESWLLASGKGDVGRDTLLASPHTDQSRGREHAAPSECPAADLPTLAKRHALSPAVDGLADNLPFFTEPVHDFAEVTQRDVFAHAIARSTVPPITNDATEHQAHEAVARAETAFTHWRDLDQRTRSTIVLQAADAMRARRDELAGVIIKENGKDWRNADADVTEAIDFCTYYARQAVRLFERRRLGRFIGELDEVLSQPRGVAAVISPWNFPLAIATGMAIGALVTGNTVILKPAEQTPGIARLMYDIVDEEVRRALDTGEQHAFQFLAGPGETVGAALVRDPRVALVAFTGSKAVGLDIIQAAGVTDMEQRHVKKVVCEMGGKNAIVVDTSADFDEAVIGVRNSTFGFAGQKCSACSRVIVVDPQGPEGPAIAQFTERLVEATRALVVGDPLDPATDIGPVIDDDARDKITGFIDRAKAGGLQCVLGAEPARLAPDSPVIPKNLIPPHIFAGVPEDHELARDEIFGPVLAIVHAPSFDEALRIANSTAYKLTGGVFSRKPSHLERAKRDFRVGNLYLNRTITGALVGRHPFGGFGMSGVGSKAGGADYLLQFVEPRAIAENTMRRGFAPELS
ncbi:MAG: proline dehydrogenase family protein [Planctomycetota bacterium]